MTTPEIVFFFSVIILGGKEVRVCVPMNETSTDLWTVSAIELLAPDGKSMTAARELLRGSPFPEVDPTLDGKGWWAVCRGLNDVYRVAVRLNDEGFRCDCNCPSRKYPCKHALALLLHLLDRPALRSSPTCSARASLDFEGLLRAIFANPDDETARLVFADYLDENDQPDRAALIRMQSEKSRLSVDDPRYQEIAAAELRWFTRVLPLASLPNGFGQIYRQGFIHLTVNADAFRDVGAIPAGVVNLFLNGWVESVRFRAPFQTVSPEAHTLLQRVGELDFTEVRQGDTDLVRLASDLMLGTEGSRLARIRVHPLDEELFQVLAMEAPASPPKQPSTEPASTTRHEYHLTPDHLGRLLQAGRFDDVRDLCLRGETLGDAGAETLAQGHNLQLTRLTLRDSGIGPSGAAALSQSPWFPRLSRLEVYGSPLVNAGVGALGRPSDLCQMTSLRLRGVGVGDPGIAELARSSRFPILESLELPGNEISELGVTALLAAEHFPKLRTIDLSNNWVPVERQTEVVLESRVHRHIEVTFGETKLTRTIDPNARETGVRLIIANGNKRVLEGLAKSSSIERVTSLVLRGTSINPEIAGRLGSKLSPKRWNELDLSGYALDENAAAVMSQFCAEYCPPRLTLSEVGMRYSAVAKLALVAALAPVRVLDLSGNRMGAGGLDALLGSPYLSGVEQFILRGLNLSQREREHFQKLFGKRAKFD